MALDKTRAITEETRCALASSLLAGFLFLSRVFHTAARSLGGIEERAAFVRPCSPLRGLHDHRGGRPRGSLGRDRRWRTASRFGFPPPLAAPLAICALVLLGGALHEDGLADCADGFSLAARPASASSKSWRDSRIGTFGAVALVLSLYLRAASLALIADESLGLAGAVLIGGAALSRAASLMPLALLPPARENGAGFAARTPERAALAIATCLAVVFALAPVVAGAELARCPRRHCFGYLLGLGRCAARSKTHRRPDRGCRGRRAATQRNRVLSSVRRARLTKGFASKQSRANSKYRTGPR